ncbi:hypothetical protein [Microbacterium trichothecenolyticum]|uniref:hypothetical protein n=1 Tax=Microbacterium trichothecenolyticum TaxID=69370 RepID=UPI0005EBFC41|nr:hypothetical protein [Microbacterium trichothecenolyticum]
MHRLTPRAAGWIARHRRLLDAPRLGPRALAPGQLHPRIAEDRAYVEALRGGRAPDDPRIDPPAPLDRLVAHDWQVQAIAERR